MAAPTRRWTRSRCTSSAARTVADGLHKGRLHQQHRHRALVSLLAKARRDGRPVVAWGLTDHYRRSSRSAPGRLPRSGGGRASRSCRRRVHQMRSEGHGTRDDDDHRKSGRRSRGIVEVQGDMHGVRRTLMAAYAAACGASTKGVVLNFDKLDFLNSGGSGCSSRAARPRGIATANASERAGCRSTTRRSSSSPASTTPSRSIPPRPLRWRRRPRERRRSGRWLGTQRRATRPLPTRRTAPRTSMSVGGAAGPVQGSGSSGRRPTG